MSDSTIASISIPVRVDFSEFNRDLQSLRSFAMPKIAINPTVNLSQLHELNRVLDIKQKHLRETAYIASTTVITPRVDTSAIRRATKEIQDFQATLKRGSYELPTIKQKVELEINGEEIEKIFRKSAGSANLGNIFSGLLNAPFKLVAEAGKQVFIGAFQAIGTPLGKELGKGLKDGIERELSFSVGSMSLIGRKMGEALSKEFADVLQDELGLVGKIMEDLIGKAETTREGASVRNRQRQQSQQTNQSGSEQIYREYDFFKANAAQLRARTEELGSRQQSAQKLEAEIQQRIAKTAEALGLNRLQQQIKDNDSQRSKYSEKLKDPNTSASDQRLIGLQLQRLSNQDRNIINQIDDVNKLAERKYRTDLDRLAGIKERLLSEENQLMRVIEAPDRLQFAIKRQQQQKTEVNPETLPQTYLSVAKQVAELTNTKIKNAQIPVLQVDPALKGVKQNYNPQKNAVNVSQEVYDQLSSGNASKKAIENLAHELVHAVQFRFGEITDLAKAGRPGLIVPTADEARKLGANIEQSTNAGTPQEASARRALEADAYTFAYRNKDAIYDQVIRQQNLSKLENTLGVGGGKASLEITRGAMEGFGKLQKYSSVSSVDVTFGLQESINKIEQIRGQVLAGLQKLDNVDLLGTNEIERIQSEIIQSVHQGIQEIQGVTEDFKQKLINNPELLQKPFTPEFTAKDLEAVTIERTQQQTAKANRARPSVDSKATANLASISDAISNGSLESDALNKVKATSDYFVQSYKRLKESIAKGGNQASKDLDLFVRAVNAAQSEIDSIVTGLKGEGVDADFASRLGGKLQGLKGQLASKRNTAQRLANRQNLGQSESDDQSMYAFEDIQRLFDQAKNFVMRRKAIDPDVLMFRTQLNQNAYDEAETGVHNRYEKATQQVNFSLENAGKSAETITGRIKRVIDANLNPDTFLGGFIQNIQNATLAIAGLGASGMIFAFLGNLARETTKAALELDSLERRFKNIEGSKEKGNSKLEELREQSDRLGVSFRETATAYAQFAASTKDTALEGFQTQQIAEAVSIAGSANGLSNERQRLVNTGFSQMLAKGKVSQEEVRGQISESLPGFIQTAARAYGVSVPELNRMISGGLDSNRFAVKVSQQMQAELAGGANEASRSPQASFNRLGNAQEELSARTGQKFLPAMSVSAEVASKAINLLAENINGLLQLLTAVTATAASFGFQGLISSSGLLSTALAFVSTQVKTLIANMGGLLPMLQRFVLITAAIETFKLLGTALSDGGGQFREFADSADKSLKKYEEALARSQGKQADFFSKLPKTASDVKGRSWLEDSIFGFLGKDNLRAAENNRPKTFWDKAFNIGTYNPLTYILPNRAEKDNRDSIKAMDDHLKRMDGASNAVRDQLSGRTSQLKELVDIDRQIEEIQAKRRGVVATSADPAIKDPQLEQLKAQEESLNRRRSTVLEPIAQVQQATAQAVEDAQKAIDGLREKMQNGEITQDQYNQKMGQYTNRLNQAKQNQDALNLSLRDSLSKLSAFEKAWQKISDISADAQKQIEVSGADAQTNVYNNEIVGNQSRGSTDSQVRRMQNDIAIQQQAARQTELLQKAAELSTQNAAQVFSNFGVTKDTRQSQLKTLAENAQGEREKKILNSYSEYLTLKDQIAQGEQQIAQAKVESARQIQDLSKSVNEFFRSIKRSSEALALDLKAMDLDTKLLGMRTKIKGAFTGFYSTFVDEFADGIMSIFEMMTEQSKNQIEANRQIQQRLYGLDDSLRQGSELSQTLPDGPVVSGGSATSQMAVGSKIPGSLKVTGRNDPDGAGYGFDYGVWDGGDSRGVGAPVAALAGGRVVEIRRNDAKYGMGGQRGFGNQVYVRVLNPQTGVESDVAYGHLDSIGVTEGQIIGRGQTLGTQGETGSATAPHVTLNVFAKGASGGGAAEVALGRLLEQSIDRGVFANVGGVQTQASQSTLSNAGARVELARTRSKDSAGLEKSSSRGFSNTFGFDPKRANQALQYYTSQGISPKAAAYLIGNFMQESGGAGWEAADNGTHRGIGQWSSDRIASAGGRLPSDFAGQLAFSLRDLAVDSPQSLAVFRNPTASDAAIQKAISGWMRYGSGEEASRFRYGSGLAKQIGGMPLAPTTGMTQGSVEAQQQLSDLSEGMQTRITDAQKIAIADSEQFINGIYSNLEAKNALSSVQIADARKKNTQRARQGVLDAERDVIAQERNLADIRNSLGDSTPEKELRKQLLENDRARQDKLKDINPQYERLTQSLEHSKALLQIIGNLPGFEDQAGALRKAIPDLERLQKHLGEVRKRINDAYGSRATDLIQKFQRAQQELRIQVAAQIQQTEVDLQSKQNESLRLRVRGSNQQAQYDYITGLNALPSAVASEKANLDQKILELEKQKREGQLTNEEFEKLRANYIAISKINLQNTIGQVERLREAMETSRENFNFAQYQQVYDSQAKLMNARKGSYALYGLQTQQATFDQELGRQQIDFDYQAQLKQLNDLVRSGDMASGTAIELKHNLDAVREIQLDNLSKQFDPMTRAIGDTRNAFEGLLNDLFNGQKSFLQSLSDFAGNIAKNLFGQASQYLADEIFGGFLKKNTDAARKDSGAFATLGVFKDRTNTEANFPILVRDAGDKFLQFSIDAANEIRNAGYEFASVVRQDQPLSSQFLNSESFGFLDSVKLPAFDTSQKLLDTSSLSFSDKLVDGASMAASILSNSGTKASDNLLGNLSSNLPGLIGDVVGLFGGKGGSGNVFGSILGIAGKIFGFAEGGIIGNGRSKADDQLILAQRGEAILSHRAVDLLGPSAIKSLNKGKLPKFASGGFIGRENLGLANMPSLNQSNAVVMTRDPAMNTNQSVNISVTVNNDGSVSTTGEQADNLGSKLANAVKAILISEKRNGGILGR